MELRITKAGREMVESPEFALRTRNYLITELAKRYAKDKNAKWCAPVALAWIVLPLTGHDLHVPTESERIEIAVFAKEHMAEIRGIWRRIIARIKNHDLSHTVH
jgi:hypothetical protein